MSTVKRLVLVSGVLFSSGSVVLGYLTIWAGQNVTQLGQSAFLSFFVGITLLLVWVALPLLEQSA